jgi:uncharacterized protein (DUF433 family)
MDKRSKPVRPLVHCDPDILNGTPVFFGTRVPFQTLMDYIEAGHWTTSKQDTHFPPS